MAHEVAHMWFGDLVTPVCDQCANMLTWRQEFFVENLLIEILIEAYLEERE